MPKFVFQLEGVLRQRKSVEEQRQRELGAAQAEMARMEAELRALDDTTQGVSEDVRNNRLTGKLDMAFLAAHRRYVLAMQRKALLLAQRMAAQQQLVDAARGKLADLMAWIEASEKVLRVQQAQRAAGKLPAK